ncbi:MAG: amidase [Nocardioidaceae bacterium]|nr:amidase [Nocardioidaceae bacterium]
MSLSTYSSARELAAAVAARAISVRELVQLHLDRIAELNPALNAIVSLDPDRAMAGATAADEVPDEARGALHGLPFAFKDTHEVAGWRTTYGSTLFADHVPTSDELIVERIRAAGVVVIGKTNVPEFAAGSHTFNKVFGTTRNPWDTSRSAGGSSGGAGAALAAGLVPLAEGSDMGGSLRNPASFNGVVGLRPSLGRVPEWPLYNQWETTSVGGPMGRSVDDVAFLLSVIAGPDPRAPHALGTPGSVFAAPLERSLAGVRVALSPTLGGAFEVDDAVAAVVEAASGPLASGGASVTADQPDLGLADDTFRTLRAWHLHSKLGALLAEHPTVLKQSLADNIRLGEGLTGADVARAYTQRTALGEVMRQFFERYDVLALPVSQVPPFPVELEFPTQINGRAMSSYLDWMRSAYLITVTGCPAISVPAGFTPDGLPVGLQLVGPHGSDRRLLEIAAGFEDAVGLVASRPPV